MWWCVLQEIYPPKVSEFAFVTDGACCVADILDMELLICKVCLKTLSFTHSLSPTCLQALNWRLNHNMVTVNTWVNVYMQISSHHLRPPGVKTREFEYPAYSPLEFIRVLQVPQFLILCVCVYCEVLCCSCWTFARWICRVELSAVVY